MSALISLQAVQAASAADGNVATATRQLFLRYPRADTTNFLFLRVIKNATATCLFFSFLRFFTLIIFCPPSLLTKHTSHRYYLYLPANTILASYCYFRPASHH